MDKYKLAFCIPTYERSMMIEEFLEEFSTLFYELGIDIYYYDSSENPKSKLVVEKWMMLYKNIQYVQVPTTWHANKKVLYIIEQFGIDQKYDYLWICGDSIRFSELVIRRVFLMLEQQYDIIIVSHTGKEHTKEREYTDTNELFQNYAWYMTLFGAVILNVHTMIKEVPWVSIKEKYEVPNRINYSHVGFYFEMICKLEKFRAFHITVEKGVWTSRLKIAGGWYHEAFKVLCEYWPSTIEELPRCLTDKKVAINRLGYCSCLTPKSFLHYRKGNVYNVHTFFRYRKILKDMSRLNTFQLWSLSCINPKIAYYIAIDDIVGYFKEIKKIYHFHNFCKKYKDIYIYGTGRVAVQYGRHMMQEEIKYSGFLVTEKAKNPDKLFERPVIGLKDIEKSSGGMGIILGLNQQNIKEVQPVLEKLGLWQDTFQEYICPIMLED